MDNLKGDGCETACTGTRDTQCVYVPYVLSVSLEFLRAVARECGVPVSLLRDMVQCVGSRLLSCHCGVVFCVWGAALDTAGKTHRLPALRGSNQRAAAPATLFRPPGHPCRKGSQTFGPTPFRILWIATAVGCQSTHARLRSPSRGGQPALASTSAPGARDHCRATGPRVCKSSLTWIHRGQPALEFGTSLSARDRKGQLAPASTKADTKLDHQGTTSPTGIQISTFRLRKMNYPSRHALRNQSTTHGTYEGNRPTCPHGSSSSAGG